MPELKTLLRPAIAMAIAALIGIAVWDGATYAWGATPEGASSGYLSASTMPAPDDAVKPPSVEQVGLTDICYGVTRISAYALDEEGSNLAHAKVSISAGGKTRTAKTNGYGKAAVKIPVAKIGTKVAVKVTDSNGKTLSDSTRIRNGKWHYSFYDAYKYGQLTNHVAASADEFFHEYSYDVTDNPENTPYYKGDWDERERFFYNVKIGATYKTSKATRVTAKFVTKGDRIKIRFGNKAYVKKVKSSAKTLTFAIPHKQFRAGTKIVATQFNKYGQKMGIAKSIVFGGKNPKVGMTEREAGFLRLYGMPTGSSASTTGEYEWFYTYDDGKKWNIIRFKDERVVSFSR